MQTFKEWLSEKELNEASKIKFTFDDDFKEMRKYGAHYREKLFHIVDEKGIFIGAEEGFDRTDPKGLYMNFISWDDIFDIMNSKVFNRLKGEKHFLISNSRVDNVKFYCELWEVPEGEKPDNFNYNYNKSVKGWNSYSSKDKIKAIEISLGTSDSRPFLNINVDGKTKFFDTSKKIKNVKY